MLHLTTLPKAATAAGVAFLLLISVVVVAQSGQELEEQYQINRMTALNDALGLDGLSEFCRRSIEEASEGLERARVSGGLWWCYNCGTEPGYSDPSSAKVWGNVYLAQPPESDGEHVTMASPGGSRPNTDLANVMIHEGAELIYKLRGIVESHRLFEDKGDDCFAHVTHPILVPPS